MNKEILCKCLLERKDEILVVTNFTSLVLISTMIALLVILFIIKLYARNNTFKYIKEKHGKDFIKIVRSYESLKTRYMKVKADIKFVKSCKRENLTPTFAMVNLAIKNGSKKLKLRIARIVMESEMQNKHYEKKKLKKEMIAIGNQLKRVLGLFLLNALVHQIEIAVKSRSKAIRCRHDKKMMKFCKAQKGDKFTNKQRHIMKKIVHNFSSYNLSQ